jgi:hypothetical protein
MGSDHLDREIMPVDLSHTMSHTMSRGTNAKGTTRSTVGATRMRGEHGEGEHRGAG